MCKCIQTLFGETRLLLSSKFNRDGCADQTVVSRWHQEPFAAQIRHNKSEKEFLKILTLQPTPHPGLLQASETKENMHTKRRLGRPEWIPGAVQVKNTFLKGERTWGGWEWKSWEGLWDEALGPGSPLFPVWETVRAEGWVIPMPVLVVIKQKNSGILAGTQ